MKLHDFCNWAVCYEIPGCTQDDGQPGRTVVGWFADPNNAQDFIDKALPACNRNRFYILHRDVIDTDTRHY